VASHLGKIYKLQVFKNQVLRKVFGPKKGEVSEAFCVLHM
jgi:hypothetical protein